MTDLRQSDLYARYVQTIGWQPIKIDNCWTFIKRIPLLNCSIIKIQRPKKIPFQKIEELAKKHRAFLIKIEPLAIRYELFTEYGYRQDSWPLLPSRTIQIDLTKSEKQLWREMKKKTRYCLRQAEKLKIQPQSIKRFYTGFKKFAKGYLPKEKEFSNLIKSFGDQAFLLGISDLAGVLILIDDKKAYYFYAFTSPAGRKVFAQHFLVWQAMKMAKRRGCQIFDFEGIEDSRYRFTRKWRGFSQFKKSFGGQEVTYPDSFSRWSLPL